MENIQKGANTKTELNEWPWIKYNYNAASVVLHYVNCKAPPEIKHKHRPRAQRLHMENKNKPHAKTHI